MLKCETCKERVTVKTAFYDARVLSLPFFSEMTVANMSVYPMELNVDKLRNSAN